MSQEAGHCGSWALDLATNDVRWSEEMCRIHGIAPDAAPTTAAAAFETVHPADRALVVGNAERMVAGRESMAVSYRILLPDGEERILWGRGEVVLDDAGQPRRMVGTCVDITEQRRSAALLERVLEVITPATGPEFFRSLAQQLAQACRVDYVLIASVDPAEPHLVRSVAVCDRGQMLEGSSITYELAGTPCANVVGRVLCHYREHVQQAFPQDKKLAEREVDSYLGIPVLSGDGKALGLIALMHGRPLAEPEQAEALLRVVAPRAGAEIERDRAESALRARESMLRGLVGVSPIPMLVVAVPSADGLSVRAGRVVLMNKRFTEVFGYTLDEVFDAESWWRRAYPDPAYRAAVQEQRHRAIVEARRRGESSIPPSEVEITCLDGSRRYVEIQGGEFGDRALLVLNDITERKRAEQALIAARELWEQSFDALAEYVSVLDASGRIVLANRAMRERFEPTHGVLTGLEVTVLYFGAATPETPCASVLNGGPPVEYEATLPTLPGSYLLSCYPLREGGADGPRRGAVHVVRDITRQRTLEESLRQSVKMQAIGQLAGGVAHDFNNLLMVILGLSERVLKAIDGGNPLRSTIATIHEAGERAAHLTRQLLLFSRNAVIEPRVLDVNEVLDGTVGMLARLIGENIVLETTLSSGLPRIRADQGQLEQVVVNLAVNGRDAMPEGGRLILETRAVTFDEEDCRACPRRRPGHFVELAVRDTGSGIPPEVQERIFEPFFTTKPVGKGTGLGLATVYGIVEQAGGFISVESTVGAGTCVQVFFPVVEGAAADSAGDAAETGALGGSETILLVEDADAVREMVRYALESCGYEVLEARGGAEGLERARAYSGPIDLLITDVIMPEVNGRRLAEALCSERRGLKVIFISGYTDDLIDRGVLETTGGFLQKPFTSLKLAQKVREILGPVPRPH
jgi:PAS domain S-box-containing protein